MRYNIIICAILKDETPYLVEWVEHHLQIGIEHFVLYDNNSIIPAKQTLETYIRKGVVEVIDCDITNTPQIKAYMHCLYNMHNHTRWIAFIDLDEFIILKKHEDISRFLEYYQNYAGVCLNWVIYTANNHITMPMGPVMQNYTELLPYDFPANKHVKSIVQPRYVALIDSPHFARYIHGHRAVNEKYTFVPGPFSEHSTEIAQINHYQTKSFEEWLDKVKRGIADTNFSRKVDDFWHFNPQMLHLKDEIKKRYQSQIQQLSV